MPDGYRICTDPSRIDARAVHAFLTRSYWATGIPFDTVERALRHSLCFGAYHVATGAQVGLARVVTDHATFAYVCDVYVLEEHRGQGLGKRLMHEVMAHPALTGARRAMLGTHDAHGLYARFGFRAPPDNGVLMQILRWDMYRTAATAAPP